MTEKEQLQAEIKEAESALEPKKTRLREIYREEEEAIAARLKLAQQGKGDFSLEELRFAATSRCSCGAGFAYPINVGMGGSWECSDILRGQAEAGSSHSGAMPFSFYEVKSEENERYRDRGITTRPTE